MDKVIVEMSDGSVVIFDCPDIPALRKFEKQYKYVASEWDYSARVGNPINHYFTEKRCLS